MYRLRLVRLWLFVAAIPWLFSGCGGHKPPGASPFALKVNLVPSPTTSVQQGNVITFTASAQNAAGSTIPTAFTFSSSDTSIMNIAPGGVACAGHWDAFYTICTPGATGVVQVTVAANTASSAATLVYVHPPIDNITVQGISLTGLPVPEPCLAQSQTTTVEAHAYSQGNDITSSVGPFTWTANNAGVVKITPLLTQVVYPNFTYNVATNQATVAAVNPGITQIYGTADGTSSTSFMQAFFKNPQGQPGPPLDFFATCPIQSITLELGQAGSGQTSFLATKGSSSSETVVATVTDLAGNSSLPNTDGEIVLSKIPLTWVSSQPQVASLPTTCAQSCTTTLQSTGAVAITASCSPPTCNIGFPYIPPSLSTPAQVNACTQYFAPLFPRNPSFSCQSLIMLPVYPTPPPPPQPPPPPPQATGAISGLIEGPAASVNVVASTFDCAQYPPSLCSTAFYAISNSKPQVGNPSFASGSANSILFDLGGDKAYMGSNFGAATLSPGNLGGGNSAFTPIGTITGRVLAVSPKGDQAVFSDTVHNPNQVYVANTSGQATSFVALNISGATAAGFSADELQTFIFGFDSNGNPNLYIYSALQAMQVIPLAGQTIDSIASSTNGAFTYIAESSGGSVSLSAFNTCNFSAANSVAAATIPLPAVPFLMKVMPSTQIGGLDSQGFPIPNGEHIFLLDPTGIDIVTAQQSPTPGCPRALTFVSGAPTPVQRIEFDQGSITPLTIFFSSDGSQIYLLATNRSSIFLYDFAASAWTGGIQLQPSSVTPVSADVSLDGGIIMVAGSDGQLHTVTTGLNGFDGTPLQFPDLTDYLNAWCNFTPASGPCKFDLLVAK